MCQVPEGDEEAKPRSWNWWRWLWYPTGPSLFKSRPIQGLGRYMNTAGLLGDTYALWVWAMQQTTATKVFRTVRSRLLRTGQARFQMVDENARWCFCWTELVKTFTSSRIHRSPFRIPSHWQVRVLFQEITQIYWNPWESIMIHPSSAYAPPPLSTLPNGHPACGNGC